MSDTKKYYYMRLVDNFYDRPEIKLIEKIENGYQYVAILMKMYLRSLQHDGALTFSDGIPYDIEMLSSVIGHDMVMIEKAIEIFQKYKLVEIMDDGTIYMTKIQNFIGQASTEADRKRQFRARIEGHAGHLSDNRPPELELELKIEKDEEPSTAVVSDGVPSTPTSSPIGKEVKSKTKKLPTREYNGDCKNTPAPTGKQLLSHFYTEYERVYGRKNEYKAINADYIQAARIVKTYGEKSILALTEYMNDGWAKDNGGHRFLSFVKNISRWINAIPRGNKIKDVENFVMG